MSEKIILEDKLPNEIRLVGGVDVAYASKTSVGAAVTLDYDSLKLVEKQTIACRTSFPYIPTLLSFREVRPVVRCIQELKTQPDVILVDGQGYAHPYHCGFASHLGLVLGKPTIGVAKGRLIGKIKSSQPEGDVIPIIHKNEIIGAAVRTKNECKPLYISVGHMVSLSTSIKIAKHCARSSRVPEPILLAHEFATQEKQKIITDNESELTS